MRNRITVLVALVCVVGMAAPAFATLSWTPTVKAPSNYQITYPWGGSQGPFKMTWQNVNPTPNIAGDDFFTFCVEHIDTFNPGGNYRINSFETSSVNGYRTMTGYSAWVYSEFMSRAGAINATKPLDRFNSTQLNAIQEAIWSGMVVGGFDYNNDSVINNADWVAGIGVAKNEAPHKGSESIPGIDWTKWNVSGTTAHVLANMVGGSLTRDAWQLSNFYTVLGSNDPLYRGEYRVARMTTLNGGASQDMTVFAIGSGGIPEPLSLLVWGGLGAVGLVARRRLRR